jgi:hypothetical protein
MTFDKETLQTLLNLPDITVDRVVVSERKTLKVYVHSTGAFPFSRLSRNDMRLS